MENLPKVRKKAMDAWPATFENPTLAFRYDLVIHGVAMQLHFDDEDLLSQLHDFFPRGWNQKAKDPIVVYWSAPELGTGSDESWDDIEDPNCQFSDGFVSQRDFLAKKNDAKTFQLMAHYKLDDGIFNFLRFLLPLELIKQDKLLFHSSCVVVDSQEPYLFFGPSGAGKTTLAKLWQDHAGAKILGDDMNILSFEDGEIYVEGAALGQRFFDPKNFGQRFRLKKAFWLTQSQTLNHGWIPQGQMAYFLSSFANLFWDQMDPLSYQKIFKLLGQLKSDLQLFQLFFPISTEVIPYVQSIHSNIFQEPRLSLADHQWRDNYHRSPRANLF